MIIPTIVSGLFSLFGDYQSRKKAKQEQQGRIDEASTNAKIKRIESSDKSASTLDAISLEQRGWKDDYLLIITTLPLVLAFIPYFVGYVMEGFKALELMPDYYWYAIGLVYIDTFGFRRMLRVSIERFIAKRLGF